MATAQKTNRNGETLTQFKRRFMPGKYVEVVQHTGQCALEGNYDVKRNGNLLATVEALNVDDAIAQTKKMFNTEVIAVL